MALAILFNLISFYFSRVLKFAKVESWQHYFSLSLETVNRSHIQQRELALRRDMLHHCPSEIAIVTACETALYLQKGQSVKSGQTATEKSAEDAVKEGYNIPTRRLS
jgi:hypothetical protein